MHNFVLKLKYQLAKKLQSGKVHKNSNCREIKAHLAKPRQKESFKSKKNYSKIGQQLPWRVQEKNDDSENLFCEFSKEIELLNEEKRIVVTIEQYVSNGENISNNAIDNLIDNDPQNIDFDNSNIDYTIPLDLKVHELDASFLQCESFKGYQNSRKNQPILRDVKIVMKHILEDNRSIFSREDFLKPRNNFDKSDATDTLSLDLVEEEVDKTVVKQEELFIKDELFDRQEESFKSKQNYSKIDQQLSRIVQEENDDSENLFCEFSKEIELFNEEKRILVSIEKYVSNGENISNNAMDNLFRNNFDMSDATDPLSLDLVEEEVDKTVVKREELFIKDEFFDRLKYQLAMKLQGGKVHKNSNCLEIKAHPAKQRQKESFKSKQNYSKIGQQLPRIVQEKNDDSENLFCEFSREIELLNKEKRIVASIEQNVSNGENISNNAIDNLFRNNLDTSDATDTLSLDLVEEEVDKTVVKQEELFIKDELFDSKRQLDVLPTLDIDKAAEFIKKKDILVTLNKCNNSFNEFVKQASESINYDTVECPSEELRISHLERSQSKPWYFICSKCDFRTDLLNVYTMHVEVFHSNSDSWKSQLIRVNAIPLKTIYTCEFCDHSTLSKSCLNSHVKSVHVNRREFKCHLCKFSANRMSALTFHVKSVHLKQKNHNCNFCDYATARKCSLTEHIETVHNSVKKFKCDLCDYMANVKSYINKHQEVHRKENQKRRQLRASLTVSKCSEFSQ